MVKRNSRASKKSTTNVSKHSKNAQNSEKAKTVLSSKSVTRIAEKMVGSGNISVTDYCTVPYSDQPLGLLGSHYSLTIKVLKKCQNGDKESVRAFLKTIPYGDEERAKYVINEGLFAKELDFYRKVVPALYAYHKGERWSPLSFHVDEEVLVLEDLVEQGYKMYANWLDDLPKMKAALGALARFHGCSILAEAYHVRKGTRDSSLLTIYNKVLRETAFQIDGPNLELVNTSIDLACELYNHFSDFKSVPSDMHSFMSKVFYEVMPSLYHRNVICHGDLCSSNMLFDSSEPIPKCVFVDFQMVRYGNQTHDVLQLLYLHGSRDWRELHEKEMLAHYYLVFTETVQASHLSHYASMPDFDQFEYAYYDAKAYGSTMASLYLPLALMDEQYLVECTKDRHMAEEFTWRNRFAITMDYLKKDEKACQRIKETVLEAFADIDLILNYNLYKKVTVCGSYVEEV